MKAREIWDVYLSYGINDLAVAEVVRRQLAASGLSVFDARRFVAGSRMEEEIRNAMAECVAMVVVVTPLSIGTTNMAVEMGAAMTWRKPVYLLTDGVSTSELSGFMQGFPVRPISQASDVASEILRELRPIDDDERDVLLGLYAQVAMSLDRLAIEHDVLQRIVQEFNRKCGRRLTPERVLQELSRLRKRGRLPRAKSTVRTRKSRVA